jgi:hypothetical protein
LGELAAARGDDPSASFEGAGPGPGASPQKMVTESAAADVGIEIDIDLGVDGSEPPDVSLASPTTAGRVNADITEIEMPPGSDAEDVVVEIDVDGEDSEEITQETDAIVSAQKRDAPAKEGAAASDTDERQHGDETASGASSEEQEDAGDDGTFDLAAELREALEDEEATGSEEVLSTVEEGFTSIFSEFKKGVNQTLSDEDHETRYDLGIAYREMGLLDDAVVEFRLCLESPERRIDSLHMLGLCSLDAERGSEAVGYLEQALASSEVEEERRSGLYFDVGRAFESVGDLSRARASFEAICVPDFPGVAERLAALDDAESSEVTSAHDGAEVTAEAEEEFESFDDMVAEVEAMDALEQTATVEEVLGTSDGEPSHDRGASGVGGGDKKTKTKTKTKKPGKKKISFV